MKLLILVSMFVVVLPIAGLVMAWILEGPTDRYLTDMEVQEILNSKEG